MCQNWSFSSAPVPIQLLPLNKYQDYLRIDVIFNKFVLRCRLRLKPLTFLDCLWFGLKGGANRAILGFLGQAFAYARERAKLWGCTVTSLSSFKNERVGSLKASGCHIRIVRTVRFYEDTNYVEPLVWIFNCCSFFLILVGDGPGRKIVPSYID